jgi:hypothetical protein
MPKCLSCLRGFCGTCRGTDDNPCDCTHSLATPTIVVESDPTGNNSDEPNRRKREYKREASLKDAASTGRKRAAVLYPLDREKDCEWAGLTEAGGGQPILGCGIRPDPKNPIIFVPVGKQTNRHHGPDYNTLNNDEGNVHRICARCHNAWHAVNDPLKDENYLARYGHAAGGSKFKGSKHHAEKNN